MLRYNWEERENATMTRFVAGLNHKIQDILEYKDYTNITHLFHFTCKVEREGAAPHDHHGVRGIGQGHDGGEEAGSGSPEAKKSRTQKRSRSAKLMPASMRRMSSAGRVECSPDAFAMAAACHSLWLPATAA
jgi:hypothetical protein